MDQRQVLGFITPAERNQRQHDAHAVACARHVAFALPVPVLTVGQAIRLFDHWKNADVVADVGKPFRRIHQWTGSCVWAGGTIAVFTTIACQRIASDSPTKAFMPFTLHNYAMSRHYMGDDGQGEGSMGSTFAQSLTKDGIREAPKSGEDLPSYSESDDAFEVSKTDELRWSSFRNSSVAPVLEQSRQHLFGSTAECKSAQDVKAMIGNGYGVAFACNDFIGNASVQGSGDDACLVGHWDSSGGHQQSIHAVWEHPSLGTLYWAQNNWPSSTYPKDPAGGPTCGCWVTEKNVDAAIRNLDAEVYGYSHLNWFPAQPKILDWLI